MQGIALQVLKDRDDRVVDVLPIDPSTLRRVTFSSVYPMREYVQLHNGEIVSEFNFGQIVLAPIGELPER